MLSSTARRIARRGCSSNVAAMNKRMRGCSSNATAMNSLMQELPSIYKIAAMQITPMWKHMAEHASVKLKLAPTTILDLACGPGEPACTLAKTFPNASVTASDFTDGMLAQAQERVAENGLGDQVTVAKLDFNDLSSIASESIDLVTCSLGLHIPVDGPSQALSEISRVLKPGGTCIATIWEEVNMCDLCMKTMEEVTGEPFQMPFDPVAWAGGRMDPLIADAGLTMASGHNSLVPFDFNLGVARGGEDLSFKLGMIMALPKLAQLGKVEEAKATYEKHAKAFGLNEKGELVIAQDYRLLVFKK
mmetsp:Transcript_9828/g.31135  ORF Transcript_9828/g.31135 Transcript_9828/m.31135 type:complete len:304 (+) Transcript_9828:40-951(+)